MKIWLRILMFSASTFFWMLFYSVEGDVSIVESPARMSPLSLIYCNTLIYTRFTYLHVQHPPAARRNKRSSDPLLKNMLIYHVFVLFVVLHVGIWQLGKLVWRGRLNTIVFHACKRNVKKYWQFLSSLFVRSAARCSADSCAPLHNVPSPHRALHVRSARDSEFILPITSKSTPSAFDCRGECTVFTVAVGPCVTTFPKRLLHCHSHRHSYNTRSMPIRHRARISSPLSVSRHLDLMHRLCNSKRARGARSRPTTTPSLPRRLRSAVPRL